MSNLIHRIWLGGTIPQRYEEYGDMWRELNPEFVLHDWNEEQIMDGEWVNDSVLKDLYNNSRKPGADMIAYYTQVADVVDYELCWKYGGLYVNTDVKPVRPLSRLNIDMDTPALAYEDDIHLVNMAMYSPTNNPLFAKIIDILPKRYFGMPKAGMHITTGVGLIMQAVSEYNGPLVRWHRDIWNPIHWSTIPGGTYPDLDSYRYPDCTIALHGWSHKEYQRGSEVLP